MYYCRTQNQKGEVMEGLVIYIVLIVALISAIVIRKDTKELIKRSDQIQKSLNAYIRKEQK